MTEFFTLLFYCSCSFHTLLPPAIPTGLLQFFVTKCVTDTLTDTYPYGESPIREVWGMDEYDQLFRQSCAHLTSANHCIMHS